VISRRTIFSLLLALLILGGLRLWALGHVDDCSRPVNHLGQMPESVMVESGDRMVEMPCAWWFPRQPLAVQMVALLGAALGLVFGLSAVGDWIRTREARRRW
jgi:hypothetical protein